MKSQALSVAILVAGVLALTVAVPWLWSELRSLPPGSSLAARSGERIVTLEVKGMTCGGCAAQVEKRLAGLAGVSAVRVRHRSERAYVVCRRDVGDMALVAAVADAGASFHARVISK